MLKTPKALYIFNYKHQAVFLSYIKSNVKFVKDVTMDNQQEIKVI